MSYKPESIPVSNSNDARIEQQKLFFKWVRTMVIRWVVLTPELIRAHLDYMEVANPEEFLLAAIQYANRHANEAGRRCRGDFDTADDIDWADLETFAQDASVASMAACSEIQEADQYREYGPGVTDPLVRLKEKMAELDAAVPVFVI